ncbi:nucleotide-binding alpha-beta plait domain-containing protein [Tanacetum coccineum]
MFSKYGNVVDVYITFKRTKKGTRFGFVMFINIGEPASFERKLKTIVIGETPLVINKAKFFKLGNNGFTAYDFPEVSRVRIPIEEDNARSLLDRYCNIKYIGGSSFLFEWSSKEIAFSSLEENKCWLQQWFTDVKPWEENGDLHGRFTWLVIKGLPRRHKVQKWLFVLY